jgi:hypothetical protein
MSENDRHPDEMMEEQVLGTLPAAPRHVNRGHSNGWLQGRG